MDRIMQGMFGGVGEKLKDPEGWVWQSSSGQPQSSRQQMDKSLT